MRKKAPNYGVKVKSRPRKTTKKEKVAIENASYLTNHILSLLGKAGINHSAKQETIYGDHRTR